MMMVQHHNSAEFETRCMDQFERLYDEGAKRLKVMAIAVHPYISGVPHRIKYFENVFRRLRDMPGVAFWTGDRILDWYRRGVKPAAKRSTAGPRLAKAEKIIQ